MCLLDTMTSYDRFPLDSRNQMDTGRNQTGNYLKMDKIINIQWSHSKIVFKLRDFNHGLRSPQKDVLSLVCLCECPTTRFKV